MNERIAHLTGLLNETGTGLLETGVTLLICECGDLACAEALEITTEEYEAVRVDPVRFVVLQGHQMPEGERVVDRRGRYLVIEKLGAAAEIATAGDPRRVDHHATRVPVAERTASSAPTCQTN